MTEEVETKSILIKTKKISSLTILKKFFRKISFSRKSRKGSQKSVSFNEIVQIINQETGKSSTRRIQDENSQPQQSFIIWFRASNPGDSGELKRNSELRGDFEGYVITK